MHLEDKDPDLLKGCHLDACWWPGNAHCHVAPNSGLVVIDGITLNWSTKLNCGAGVFTVVAVGRPKWSASPTCRRGQMTHTLRFQHEKKMSNSSRWRL